LGNTGFGNPFFGASLNYENSLDYCPEMCFLSFRCLTRICANDVDFPIDTVVLETIVTITIESDSEQKGTGTNLPLFGMSATKMPSTQLPAEHFKERRLSQTYFLFLRNSPDNV